MHKIPNASMAVNTSLVAIPVQLDGRYNTTALFYYSPKEKIQGEYIVFYPDIQTTTKRLFVRRIFTTHAQKKVVGAH